MNRFIAIYDMNNISVSQYTVVPSTLSLRDSIMGKGKPTLVLLGDYSLSVVVNVSYGKGTSA